MEIDVIREEVIKYIKTFDLTNKDIKSKYFHTLEVEKIMQELASRLCLKEEQIKLARVIGLLHDIGRFEQIKQYNNLIDRKTVDHADYGVELLFKKGLITQFKVSDNYYSVIEKAIKYHNKLDIPNDLNSFEDMFVKMIRDADKIDIYRVRGNEIENKFIDIPNPEIVNDFMNELTIDLKKKTNKTDSVICVMAFIYDINYRESLIILNKTEYYSKFLSTIEVSEELTDLFVKLKTKVLEYIENRCSSTN